MCVVCVHASSETVHRTHKFKAFDTHGRSSKHTQPVFCTCSTNLASIPCSIAFSIASDISVRAMSSSCLTILELIANPESLRGTAFHISKPMYPNIECQKHKPSAGVWCTCRLDVSTSIEGINFSAIFSRVAFWRSAETVAFILDTVVCPNESKSTTRSFSSFFFPEWTEQSLHCTHFASPSLESDTSHTAGSFPPQMISRSRFFRWWF